ncbi:MAG: sensor histidine kinase, partial [Peptostreptococcaceae bacterium]
KESIQLDNHVKLIRQNSYRLLRLVNNLIDMSKIDSGFYKLNLSNNDIVYIVEEISLSVVSYANENGIKLIFDTDCEELIVSCDPDKIERILLNLLSNSIKNTKCGGCIHVNLTSNEEKVIISVIDNGKGIPKNKLGTIFNRFEQVDDLLNRSYEGSGIGLSLVQSLVKMHGGNISVESEVGVGSKFEFDIINKKMNSDEENSNIYKIGSNKIEKCDIEFSDIYK